jgi:uncharacterized protein (TIGR03437 family)
MKAITARCLLVFAIVFPALLAGQVPRVAGVFNQGSREAGLSPGVLALVQGGHGTVFGDMAVVTVGGLPAAVLERFAAVPEEGVPDSLRVQLPVELEPGATILVVTTSAGSSEPFDITLQDFSPAVLGFVSEESPVPTNFSCFPLNAADPGDTVTLAMVGLGPTNPVVPTGMTPGAAAPTVASPIIRVGAEQIEVLESVLSPDEVGVYRLTFQLPAAEGEHELLVGIGGRTANPVPIAVGRAIGTITSAWRRRPAAPDSIQLVRTCGVPLIEPTVPGAFGNDPSFFADSPNPPTALGGVTVEITDASGVARLAPLLYVSPVQINYLVPAGTADGFATVKVISADGGVLAGRVQIQPVAPVLFGAALLVRLREGVQTVEVVRPPISVADGIAHNAPNGEDGEPQDGLPIDMGPDTDQVYLVLFATGLRHRSSPGTVSVDIGGFDAPVVYADAQDEFAGLDQVNIALPRTLLGPGDAELLLTVDGIAANIMYLSFR